jgi:hypothetical protein
MIYFDLVFIGLSWFQKKNLDIELASVLQASIFYHIIK